MKAEACVFLPIGPDALALPEDFQVGAGLNDNLVWRYGNAGQRQTYHQLQWVLEH